jgi:DNA-binding response OmpR family regulator
MNKPQKKRILIVEDDLTLEPFWRQISKHLDFQPEVEWVISESAAERAIFGKKSDPAYDLVICDIFLEGRKTGIDLWRKCRDMAIDFVFSSGVSREKFETLLSHENGTHPLLSKPLDPTVCISTINSMLR